MYGNYEGYEFINVFRRLWVPLVSIPSIERFLFIKLSRLGRRIRRSAASYRALEMIYTYSRDDTRGKGILERLATHILLHCLNAKAVRNRLKLVKEELEKIIVGLDKNDIHIMSLGSGSARAVIETLVACNGESTKYTVTLVDQSQSALNFSKQLAVMNGVLVNVTLVRGMLEEFVKNGRDHPPDIVEMVGIMDYFDDATAQEVLGEIYRLLLPGGVLITCNIHDNPERPFMTKVMDWPMVYRNAEELSRVMRRSGFNDHQITYEPLGIHGVAVGRKV